jgi:hypothetical protein
MSHEGRTELRVEVPTAEMTNLDWHCFQLCNLPEANHG